MRPIIVAPHVIPHHEPEVTVTMPKHVFDELNRVLRHEEKKHELTPEQEMQGFLGFIAVVVFLLLYFSIPILWEKWQKRKARIWFEKKRAAAHKEFNEWAKKRGLLD